MLKKKNSQKSFGFKLFFSADGGGRTHTVLLPIDFESFASAIPPHRLIFNFGTLAPFFEDWRDVQEGCKKSRFGKLSKFNIHS